MKKENIFRITSILCLFILVAATVFVIFNWQIVPDEIPLHYNLSGEADRYGGKGALIVMMILAWVAFVVISISTRFPDSWNMPVKVTDKNKTALYNITRNMLEIIKIIVTLLFTILFVSPVNRGTPPQWIIFALSTAIFITVAISIFLMNKKK